MNQILRCDWLPERARWSYLARSGLPAESRKKNFPESHIINPLLTILTLHLVNNPYLFLIDLRSMHWITYCANYENRDYHNGDDDDDHN